MLQSQKQVLGLTLVLKFLDIKVPVLGKSRMSRSRSNHSFNEDAWRIISWEELAQGNLLTVLVKNVAKHEIFAVWLPVVVALNEFVSEYYKKQNKNSLSLLGKVHLYHDFAVWEKIKGGIELAQLVNFVKWQSYFSSNI